MTNPVDALLGKFLQHTLIQPGTSKAKFVAKKIGQRLVGRIAKFYDPVVDLRVEGRTIKAPLSHNLPNLLSENPYYDRALPRLARAILNAHGRLCMIDVGANIGDSVNLVDQAAHGQFLCVEPSAHFFPLLVENTRRMADVTLENVGAGEIDERSSVFLQEHRGSARVRSTVQESEKMEIATLDSLAEKHPAFKQTNLIKIDTDGFDYKTIRGARRLLQTAKSAVYFELSPDHMIHIGHEDPMVIFPFLAELGYSHLLFYDQHGYPIAPVNIRETETIRGILGYGQRKIYYWLDVLAMHDSEKALFDSIVQSEYSAIPVFVRPYFR